MGAAAVRAEWITPQDPIIVTADGGRLPTVPLAEAEKLSALREELGLDGEEVADMVEGDECPQEEIDRINDSRSGSDGSGRTTPHDKSTIQGSAEGSLRKAKPPSRTNPLFPPLPLYGPPTKLRDIQCMVFRVSSFFLSLAFLAVIVLGSIFTSIPLMLKHIWTRVRGKNPDEQRPFYHEEQRRRKIRKRLRGSGRGVDDQDDTVRRREMIRRTTRKHTMSIFLLKEVQIVWCAI